MEAAKHQPASDVLDELQNVQASLEGIFDEIGLSSHEKDKRTVSLYEALNQALQEQLRVVAQEKNQYVDECHKIISQIKQMERSLSGNDSRNDDDEQMRITRPLLKCLQGLKEKHKQIKRRHAERYDSVKKLVHALDTYASRLEPSIIQIPLPPITNDSSSIASFDLSHSYYERLEQEFNRVYQEFTRRVSTVDSLAKEIINLYAELGIPSAQIDRSIIEYGASEPERLGLSKEDIDRLRSKKTRLIEEKEGRIAQVEGLKKEVGELWVKLGMEEHDKRRFLAQHKGFDLKCIQDFENELERLLQLKRENLHVFVEDARDMLQDLWDKLFYSEDERMEFSPAHSDVYTDALLSAHEMEITRLERVLRERAPMLTLIEKHRSLMSDKEQLAISSNDASRLMGRGASGNRDPTRLLREEKMRKRIQKELPRVELELKKMLEKWEDDTGEPFTVMGENYLETLIRNSPVCQSRLGTRTPVPAAAPAKPTGRGRAHTISIASAAGQRPATAMGGSRPKSRMGEQPKQPQRSKTPTPLMRSKTPTFTSNGGGTIGRSTGRPLYTDTARAGTADRAGARTPGLGGRIPQPTKTPTRIARPPLANLDNSPGRDHHERNTSTITRGPSVKRKTGPPTLGTAPKMQQLKQTPARAYLQQQLQREQRESDTPASIRSISPPEPNYEVAYYDDEEEPEEDTRATPRAFQGGHIRTYLSPSVQGKGMRRTIGSDRDTTPCEGRNFSVASSGTDSSMGTGNSGSENWETYGEDSEEEVDPREEYYRQQQAQAGCYGKSNGAVTMIQAVEEDDEWMSEC